MVGDRLFGDVGCALISRSGNLYLGVWKDDNGATYALPQCGRWGEFLCQIDEDDLNTDVILGRDRVSKVKDLVPRHE